MIRNLLLTGSVVLACMAVTGCSGDASSSPGPKGSQPTSPGTRANPVPVHDRHFVVRKTKLRLPGYCTPAKATRILTILVAAFNAGEASRMGRFFGRRGAFDAYAATTPAHARGSVRGAAQVASFVRRRHPRGDAWTMLFVDPPLGKAGLPETAVYDLGIRVTVNGRTISEGGAKAVVDCRSGHIVQWVGPSRGPT